MEGAAQAIDVTGGASDGGRHMRLMQRQASGCAWRDERHSHAINVTDERRAA